ncbi:hypothetical protein TRFO_24631 [Tritrichomonas foetus]|uniref:Uncharacterized protein n=1 Tax=Tritrichomonas foetus TaxID=1144522 RepID=A0A1J4K7D2_9EUKA|nr:hypothetical protein TRFO_24631 [Tritrichomonas foetus]|eukprot:OHT07287.1 hypothetical protein TRFO_24631 [Tritrichomonas foetus]
MKHEKSIGYDLSFNESKTSLDHLHSICVISKEEEERKEEEEEEEEEEGEEEEEAEEEDEGEEEEEGEEDDEGEEEEEGEEDEESFLENDQIYFTLGRAILNNTMDLEQKWLHFGSILYKVVGHVLQENFIKSYNGFLRELKQKRNALFDPYQLGKSFTKYLKTTQQKSRVSVLLTKSCKLDNLEELLGKFQEVDVLIAKVPKPAHCYHLIQPSYVKYYQIREELNYLQSNSQIPHDHLLFCLENCDFKNKLNKLMDDDHLFIIVHPENLLEDDLASLQDFISIQNIRKIDQILSNSENNGKVIIHKKYPKVLIITSLPLQFWKNNEKIFKEFTNEDILEFANYSASMRNSLSNCIDVFLFTSKEPGAGKTHLIKKLFDSYDKQVKKYRTKDFKKDFLFNSIFFDITTEYIPPSIGKYELTHITLSPELFLNEFRLMDQLYLLIQYGFYTFHDGTCATFIEMSTRPAFLIEIPVLGKRNYLHSFYDFPISVSMHDKPKYKNSFYNIIVENNIKVENGLINLNDYDDQLDINDAKIEKYVNSFFKNKPLTIEQIIKESLLIFSPTSVSLSSKIPTRLLFEFKKMLTTYLGLIEEQNQGDDKIQKFFLFLLTLRSLLFFCNLIPQIKSLVILVPQKLMTNKIGKWVIIGFHSQLDESHSWNTDNLVDPPDLQINDKNIFDVLFNNGIGAYNGMFHILSDKQLSDNNSSSNKKLQLHFLQTTLKFFPDIDREPKLNAINSACLLTCLLFDTHRYSNNFGEAVNCYLQNSSLEEKKLYVINNKIISEWEDYDQLLYDYVNSHKTHYVNVNTLIQDLRKELINNHLLSIINLSFSKTSYSRFVKLLIKIYFRHFEILEGDTGCGKTAIVSYLFKMISFFKGNEVNNQIPWRYFWVDCHGSICQKDIIETLERIKEKEGEQNVIIFFDEINTSPAYYFIINKIQNDYIRKKYAFVAAINAFAKIDPLTRIISRVGIQQKIMRKFSEISLCAEVNENLIPLIDEYDINQYAYNVKRPQKSIKYSIVPSDPTTFEEKDDYYLPSEEKMVINTIIKKHLIAWKNNQLFESDIDCILKIISLCLIEAFLAVRNFMKIRAILSYRDVVRTAQFFTAIVDYFYKKEENEFNANKDKIVAFSLSVSFYLTILCRFSQSVSIDETEANYNDLKDRIEKSKLPLSIPEKGSKVYVFNLRKAIFEKIIPKQPSKYAIFTDWEMCTLTFSNMKCKKYLPKKTDILLLPSLLIHLLALSLTISISYKNMALPMIPCLLIGLPGVSKTKAIELFKKYYLKKHPKKYFFTTYLCSRSSESEGLLSQFLNGAAFIMMSNNHESKAIVILDEVGMASLNPNHPLKMLHYLCEKGVNYGENDESPKYQRVIPIQVSNYSLDFANMNRGLLICTNLPNKCQISYAYAFRDCKKPSDITISNIFQIIQDETNRDKYEKLINLFPNKSDTDFSKQQNRYYDFLTKLEMEPNHYSLRNLFTLLKLLHPYIFGTLIHQSIDYTLINIKLNLFIQSQNNKKRKKLFMDIINPAHFNHDHITIKNHLKLNPIDFLQKSFKGVYDEPVLVQTKNYEFYDYSAHILTSPKESDILNLFRPYPFENISENCIKTFQKLQQKAKESKKKKRMLLVFQYGNHPFSDQMLDILNGQTKKRIPVTVHNGFPIYYPNFPDNIRFIFVMNKDVISNPNLSSHVSMPLLDRLNPIYIDENTVMEYMSKDNNDSSLSKVSEHFIYSHSDVYHLKESLIKKDVNILKTHFQKSYMKNLTQLLNLMNSKGPNNGFYFSVVITKSPVYSMKIISDNNKNILCFSFSSFISEEQAFHEITQKMEDKFNLDLNDDGTMNDETKNDNDTKITIIISRELRVPNKVEDIDYTVSIKNLMVEVFNYFKINFDQTINIILMFHVQCNDSEVVKPTLSFPVFWIEDLTSESSCKEIFLAIFDGKITPNLPIVQQAYKTLAFEIIDNLSQNNSAYAKRLMNFKKTTNENKGSNTDKKESRVKNNKGRNLTKSKVPSQTQSKPNDLNLNTIFEKLTESYPLSDSEDIDLGDIQAEIIENYQTVDYKTKFFNKILSLSPKSVKIVFILIFTSYVALKQSKSFQEDLSECFKLIKELNKNYKGWDLTSFDNVMMSDSSIPFINIFQLFQPYFSTDSCYLNSLSFMKKILDILPFKNRTNYFQNVYEHIFHTFYCCNNSINSNDPTILNSILIYRSVLSTENNVKDFVKFWSQSRNFYFAKFSEKSIIKISSQFRKYIEETQIVTKNSYSYKGLLLNDIINGSLTNIEAQKFPHPFIVYQFFLNNPEFNFDSYSENGIFAESNIPWILNFFVFGNVNEKNFDRLTYFLKEGLKKNNIMLQTTGIRDNYGFRYFLCETQFIQKCRNHDYEIKDVQTFIHNIHTLDEAFTNDSWETGKYESISSEIQSSKYQFVDIHEASKNIKENVKIIHELDEIVSQYESFNILNDERSILELIQTRILSENYDIHDVFGTWLFNHQVPLLYRQVYALCKAIKDESSAHIIKEYKILCKLLNPWNNNEINGQIFWYLFNEKCDNNTFVSYISFSEAIESVITQIFDNKGDLLLNCTPFYICNDHLYSFKIAPTSAKSFPIPIHRLLYIISMFKTPYFGEINKKSFFEFFKYLPFCHFTKYLYVLAAFTNFLSEIFNDQLNLLYLFVKSRKNCIDLLEFKPKMLEFNAIFSKNEDKQLVREALLLLREALQVCDSLYQSSDVPCNAYDKLNSFIKDLIQIHNNTILYSKNKSDSKKNSLSSRINFRFVSKNNLHSKLSIFNSFVPALAHIYHFENDQINILIESAKILLGQFVCPKDDKISYKLASTLPCPSLFDTYSYDAFRRISKLHDHDIFGNKQQNYVNSLCDELKHFIKSNPESYRAKIFSLIKANTQEFNPSEDPIDTLMPLFEETDNENTGQFFSRDEWLSPSQPKGIANAYEFLKSTIVNEKSLLQYLE